MERELLVKKLMESETTVENVKSILVKELNNEHVECIGEVKNLKLHDVSYYICEELSKLNLSVQENSRRYCAVFDLFCEDQYEQYKDFKTEKGVKEEVIGKSSSFYLIDDNDKIFKQFYMCDYNNEKDIEVKKSMLMEEFIYHFLNTDEDYIEEEYNTKEDFEYMVKEFEDFVDYIKDIFEVYKYINETKENQLKYFKEWYEDFYIDVYGDILNKVEEDEE